MDLAPTNLSSPLSGERFRAGCESDSKDLPTIALRPTKSKRHSIRFWHFRESSPKPAAISQQRTLSLVDEVEVTRNGRTDQFSITLVRGSDTIRCMVSVALGGADERSDGEKLRAALSKAKALAKALDSAIASS